MSEQCKAGPPAFLDRLFPEKRIFVKSDAGTRFVRIGPRQHLLAGAALTVLVGWSVIATSLLVIDIVKGAGAREQALTERTLYERRLGEMAEARDAHRLAALQAQDTYAEALQELSAFQDRLFAAELRIRELDQSHAALERVLTETMSERDTARERLAALEEADTTDDVAALDRRRAAAEKTLDFMTQALSRTAAQRDSAAGSAEEARARLAALERDMELAAEERERIFARLDEAVTGAMEPLGEMFGDVGLPPEKVLSQMRRQYAGQGGPLRARSVSAKNVPPTAAEARAEAILAEMDRLNLFRIAADKVPFAVPYRSRVRFTSGFGPRGGRMHEGVDWAGPHGSPIVASADGVVTRAGWLSGYGRIVKIKHAFGIETRFAHLARIDVSVGQRVSRGERIGAMGNSGRSTGTHLHYEIRVGGEPVDPMIYIKAARDVF